MVLPHTALFEAVPLLQVQDLAEAKDTDKDEDKDGTSSSIGDRVSFLDNFFNNKLNNDKEEEEEEEKEEEGDGRSYKRLGQVGHSRFMKYICVAFKS